MSSRKRKNNTIRGTDESVSKRARLLSSLWNSQEEETGSSDGFSCRPSSSVYTIKAIIGERPAEYLIDWADDPITGETFSPDWQPKANVNVAAIRSWEEKDCNRTKKQNSGPRRQRRRRKRSASSKTSTTTNITVQQQVRQVQHISETPSRTSNNSASTNRNQTPTGIQSNPSLLEIAVHISQHSNLAKYHSTGYRPALSSEKSSPSLAKHPDFGLGDSSPSPETGTLSSYITQGYCIVPDSQSLPGSSSYVPSSSTSISVRATHTARLNRSSISFLGESHTSRDFTSTNFDSSSILAIATANGSIKDFPEIDVAASQPPVEISSKAEFPASQRFVAESCPPSASAVSSRSGDHLIISVKQHNNNTYNGLQTLRETSRRRNISSELFGISEDCIDNSHPSQATTTDDSVLSLRDPNSQTAQPRSEPCKGNTDRASSTNLSKTILPPTLDSQEPPQPPSISDDEMSDTITNDAHVREGLQSLSTKEKLKRMREASAAKKEAARKGQQPNLSSAQASPSASMERQLSQPPAGQGLASILQQDLQPVLSPIARTPPEALAQGQSQQPLSPVGHATSVNNRGFGQHPLSPIRLTGSPVGQGSSKQPLSPARHAVSALSHESSQQSSLPVSTRSISQQPLSSTIQAPSVWTSGQQARPSAGVASLSFSHDQVRVQVQSPGVTQARAGTNTPEIPNKLAYQVQEEPERLEVQPLLISTELPLPVRSSQSVPHTPATPSRLVMHKEATPSQAPPSQTMSLEPRNIGKMEFIIPLCMQKRILQQYVDTMNYYEHSIRESMTSENLSDKSINDLNVLLGRLADVATHIGLEGGGPGSQDSVKSEHEALYAEMSSEKFKFLKCLFEAAKDDDLHIALIAKPGPLHDIVETFLKGKKVRYNRPATFSRSDPRNASGRLQVSVLASGRAVGSPIEVARKADLVIALDETFNANDTQVLDLRKTNTGGLAPVIRLIIYASVEHLDLCLPRTLEPINRLRKLISCVCYTQSIVGELQDHEPNPQVCANYVATFLRGNTQKTTWSLPTIQPIPNLPVMDSDSSLSDAMSDVSVELGRPSEIARKYWPYNPPVSADNPYASVVPPGSETLPNGKRAYDLEYGDSLEIQAKKQKMAQRAHAGLPLEEPHTVENLEKWLAEAKAREQRLTREAGLWKDTANSHSKWAEKRQFEYESLRDKCSNLHHDKIELKEELAKLTKSLEKARLDRITLQGERGALKKELEDSRQQLINHPIPEAAEGARKDAQIRTLQEEHAAIRKKLDLANGQLEYTRGMYQDSSSRAVELASELEGLQKIFEPTKSKLEHEIARRKHERENDPRLQQLELAFEEIQTLRAALDGKDRMIKRKEDQITVLERGRGAGVQTRGSSAQPRSPRGAGSRGVSPAAGMLGGGGGKGPSGLSGRFNIE